MTWGGTKALNGGKAYVAASLGQLHYRDVGSSDLPPLLLLHQCPQSMIEFGAAQNVLVEGGLRSIAVDLPGYGLSDHPTVLPTIGGFADNFIDLLDALELPQVVAYGNHTGACVAAALAARHPQRVAAVILHGCPLYSEEQSAAYAEKQLWDCTPVKDGRHMSQLFDWAVVGDMSELINLTWMSVGMLLQSRDIGHWAVNRYRLADDIARIEAPGAIISEVEDLTHEMDQQVRALRPDFGYFQVNRPGNSLVMGDPARFSCLIGEIVRQLLGGRTVDPLNATEA